MHQPGKAPKTKHMASHTGPPTAMPSLQPGLNSGSSRGSRNPSGPSLAATRGPTTAYTIPVRAGMADTHPHAGHPPGVTQAGPGPHNPASDPQVLFSNSLIQGTPPPLKASSIRPHCRNWGLAWQPSGAASSQRDQDRIQACRQLPCLWERGWAGELPAV